MMMPQGTYCTILLMGQYEKYEVSYTITCDLFENFYAQCAIYAYFTFKQ